MLQVMMLVIRNCTAWPRKDITAFASLVRCELAVLPVDVITTRCKSSCNVQEEALVTIDHTLDSQTSHSASSKTNYLCSTNHLCHTGPRQLSAIICSHQHHLIIRWQQHSQRKPIKRCCGYFKLQPVAGHRRQPGIGT